MNKQPGFTLIEILLAMGVFLVGVVSILAVFPQATFQTKESNDDNIAAAFAESMMETLSKGLKAYTGDPLVASASETLKDLVFFTVPLDSGDQNDSFILPRTALPTDPTDPNYMDQEHGPGWTGPGTAIAGKDGVMDDWEDHMTWYPLNADPANPGTSWVSTHYDGIFDNYDVTSSPYSGFPGFVRRMGRAALGASDLVKQIESTEEDLPERLKDLYWCFSVKHEGTTPNLYHFTLYIFHNGVVPNGTDTRATAHQLLDQSRPQAKGNKFFHKFDFLIGRT